MRGSPLFRSIVLAIALVCAGLGLSRLTARHSPRETSARPTVAEAAPSLAGRFHLMLSHPANSLEISTGRQSIADPASPSGTLEFDPANPFISLIARFPEAPAAGEHRFAKLTLEFPGRPTITHVFDSASDIDELLELPIPRP